MFVYLTVCKVNGKKYIGKYEGKETDKYLGSGKLLKRAIEKYGESKFERIILERYRTAEECREGEKLWISRFDAVTSKDFYNIASRGEGGNTFAGILGEERVKLIAKLRSRKKREANYKGTLLCYDIRKKSRVRVSLEEYLEDKYLIGNSCKGLYITPNGVFASAKIASKYNEGLDYTSLAKRCKSPDKQVTKSHIAWDRRLTAADLEKTFLELGYSFIELKKITEEYINTVKLIKI